MPPLSSERFEFEKKISDLQNISCAFVSALQSITVRMGRRPRKGKSVSSQMKLIKANLALRPLVYHVEKH